MFEKRLKTPSLIKDNRARTKLKYHTVIEHSILILSIRISFERILV